MPFFSALTDLFTGTPFIIFDQKLFGLLLTNSFGLGLVFFVSFTVFWEGVVNGVVRSTGVTVIDAVVPVVVDVFASVVVGNSCGVDNGNGDVYNVGGDVGDVVVLFLLYHSSKTNKKFAALGNCFNVSVR